MSFQAYLDTIEDRTGMTPRELLAVAHEKGLDAPGTKAGQVVAWFAEEHGLGRGHAMAFWRVLTQGPTISGKYVGTGGTHAHASDTLWLDGKATKPS
ncbi:DUF4287 domain-containing protein [Cellulomonas shaoxiangyii]|uniref:DUF4287 domain-containing protein n=1 Tax=Cellulomonas shaoxiangyii TaxID=2566013 RepID=A0A4P7SFS9_9CELL|nr:DUF4287 domain-containing protein [Cellulomonas shaoxiangyii]QCB92760.1 DUF4287 domain-containing protein [Cellulomonas shaoxiangyii]TGY81526.1 DUF4287 domain-containing protein [Cellulomonas shaoxiangyii]